MRKDQIASFVTDILNADATLFAVDDDSYFFGDLVVADDKATEVWAKANHICERYGPRDHLRREIAAHLKYLGKVTNLDGESDVLCRKSLSATSMAD
ncbi:hypothetical protein [Rhizobium rhizophilum]|uniref:Uncharacterized protein n=1 Tax=Rhizobium rhizophilum TaxID=1850373 RepID=A0ABY2QR69_9HYPH|nr:hypothetical protein [Rhizobium rhizophilum]THV12511.1 hypothetical protein E9677_17285 [Rhizobium rhizophilum]